MANTLTYMLLILLANELAFGEHCSKVDSLIYHNITRCSIVPVVNTTAEDIQILIENDQVNLLKITFEFPENTQKSIRMKQSESVRVQQDSASFFYDLFNWQIIVSHISDKLLTLKPNFQTLSLNTLTVGIEGVNIKILAKPLGCLGNVTHHEYLYIVKEYLLHIIESISDEKIKICTSVVRNIEGNAKFHPVCYGVHKKNGSRSCNYLETGRWSYGLSIFIYTIKFIAILFCPILIPASIYNSKYLDNAYRISLDQKLSIQVMVSDRKLPENAKNWKFYLPISYFKKWLIFNPDNLEEGVVYNFEVTALHLGVKSNTLVSKSHVPASLTDLIYEKCYLCKIGHDLGFRWCCYSSICPQHMQFHRSRKYTCMSWMKCCQGLMKLVLVMLIPQPWILRLIVYYYYEKIDFESRRLAAESQGLSMSFKGYLLGYIPPIHWFFLAIYILYVIDLFIFGTLVKSVFRELVKIIKESFQDMNASLSFEILRWGVSRYLVPFSYFGLLGILLAPFYWVFITPFVLVLFCFYYIPLVSLFFRLFLHLFWFCLPDCAINSKCFSFLKDYAEKTHLISRHLKVNTISPDRKIVNMDRRAGKCVHRHFQILVVFLCLFTVMAITILITECIGYLIDILAFTLIGMILHTNTVLPYFSFVFMIVIYFSTSIKDVRLTYLDFNKIIISEVISNAQDQLKPDAQWSNTAYFIKADGDSPPNNALTFGKSGAIYFHAVSLLLFINEEDHAYIPCDFFYKICEMPVSTCPGARSVCYFKAFVRFLYILLFLIFVMIVVLSFGGLYNISSTHQMFAALAGGFLPWLFQNVIQLNPAPEQVNTSTLSFKKHFWSEIKNFEQIFKVRDVEFQLLSKKDTINKRASTTDLSSDQTVIEIQRKSESHDKHNANRYVYFAGSFQGNV